MLYLNFQAHVSSRSRDRLIQFFERGAFIQLEEFFLLIGAQNFKSAKLSP